jgi:hypothetical protein
VDDSGDIHPLPSGVLYEEDHLCQLHRILKPDGILNIQVRISQINETYSGEFDYPYQNKDSECCLL